MYNINGPLGEAPGAYDFAPGGFKDWLPNEEVDTGDVDLIGVVYYSPDANYPPQRISNYDLPLAQHMTLDGIGLVKLPSKQRSYLGSIVNVRSRVLTGEPTRAVSPQMHRLRR
jgi:hypothetical protein